MSKSNGKKLVIVESPAKAKTINKILGKDFSVSASVGHVIDLPSNKLGVDIENGFQPEYTVIKGKNDVIKKLKSAAKGVSEVLLATDPDREGEAIAYFVADSIKKINTNIQRIEFNEITKPAVLRALENPRTIDMDRVQAQQARRVMDRIVGYQVSPVLWSTIHKGLSAGRVQSVALRLICEREDEIEKFVPVEYWSITADLETESKEKFSAKLVRIGKEKLDPNKFRISNQGEAQKHYEQLLKEKFQVSKIKREKINKRPAPPFITSTLQQDAARRFGMTTSRIMSNAQKLYEGINIGEKGEVGLITYMRSDSVRVSPEAIKSVREYVASSYGPDYLPPKPNVYKTKKGAQDAHEAIRPTYISSEYEPKKLKPFLTPDQFKVYDLIWKRFVASQLKPAVADRLTIEITAGDYLFRASGEVITFRGWMLVYQPQPEEKKNDDEDGEQRPENLPQKISEGEVLNLLELILKQHFTKPPGRFSESSLVKMMDRLGIGRPSTYAAIISTLFNRKYIVKMDRALAPTELGRTVNFLLVNNFPDIFNVQFTANMEEGLDKIEQHESSYGETLDNFYLLFKKTLDQVTDNIKSIKQSLQKDSGEKCDNCGKPMLIKWGRNGQFLACSGYPECKNTRPLEAPPEPIETDEKCDNCGSTMVIRQGRYGEFMACSRYPECKTTKPISTGVSCPNDGCNGTLVQKQSRKGKIFFGCDQFPKCNYAIWNKPRAQACGKCGFPLVEEKTTRNDGFFLQCPTCKHKEKVEEL